MKKVVALFLAIIISLLGSPVYAHPTNMLGTYTNVEQCKWIMNEVNHANATTIYYYFSDPAITETMKNHTRTGAARWNSYGSVIEDTSGPNKKPYARFVTTNKTDMSWNASTRTESSSAPTHCNYWVITINLAKTYDPKVAAHEFGHVFGLKDLYNINNTDQLMYGYMSGSATYPRTYDAKGFRVITGQHTNANHSFGNAYYRAWEASTEPFHRQFCTGCNIARDTVCSPQVGRCNTCGFTH